MQELYRKLAQKEVEITDPMTCLEYRAWKN